MHDFLSLGTVINNRYQVLQSVGQGATAVVYLVWDQRLEKQWALKAIKKDIFGLEVSNGLHEAKILLELEHLSLPRVIDVFEWSTYDIIVRDYVNGVNMDEFISAHGPFRLHNLRPLAKEIADVLTYLHERPVPLVYRDLKPANIIVKPEGHIALVDFGIARQFNPLHYADTMPLGTKGYSAPEQFGSGQSGPWTDVYGFGALLYFLLCGEHYFQVTFEELWDSFGSLEMKEARCVIEKCMAHRIEDRFKSVTDAFNALYFNADKETGSQKIAAPKEATATGSSTATAPGDSAATGFIQSVGSKMVYGFMGVQRGVGTTHVAWALALTLKCKRMDVAFVLQHPHHTFETWYQFIEGERYEEIALETDSQHPVSFKSEGITIFPRQSPHELLKILDKNYDVVVVDFGVDTMGVTDFLRCHRKWIVCPSTPHIYSRSNWILKTMKSFDEVNYLFNLTHRGNLPDLSDWLGLSKTKLACLPFCDHKRLDDSILQNFGLFSEGTTKKKRIGFWKSI